MGKDGSASFDRKKRLCPDSVLVNGSAMSGSWVGSEQRRLFLRGWDGVNEEGLRDSELGATFLIKDDPAMLDERIAGPSGAGLDNHVPLARCWDRCWLGDGVKQLGSNSASGVRLDLKNVSIDLFCFRSEKLTPLGLDIVPRGVRGTADSPGIWRGFLVVG